MAVSASARLTIPARPAALESALARTALIVVDMQNAYLSKGGYLDLIGTDISQAPRAIAGTKAVLAAARAAGIKVVFLQNGFDPKLGEAVNPLAPVYHKSNALRYMREHPDDEGKLIVRGTWDHQFADGFAPAPGESVVHKARYSGFAGTNLDSLLRGSGIDTLILVGVNANVCVESTLRDAYHREYFAVMVSDATYQSGPQMMMEATLFNVETFFGWTSTVEHVCSALAATRAGA